MISLADKGIAANQNNTDVKPHHYCCESRQSPRFVNMGLDQCGKQIWREKAAKPGRFPKENQTEYARFRGKCCS